MNVISRYIILFIAQGAYAGKIPYAPGTMGTFVAVGLYLLTRGISPSHYVVLCVLLCGIGIWTAHKAERILGCTDCPSIVIDEIAGFFIAMAWVPAGWGFLIAGFILFRFFDIVKPWPLDDLQGLRGGLGVMMDDIGAGIYTNMVLQIAAYAVSA
jgi:phosphatidylglycerophosphatase A